MGTNGKDSDDWSRAVAAQIAAERAAARMTQTEVFDRAGMARSTYLRIESGARPADISQLGKIAGVFGLSTSQLILRAEQRAMGASSESLDSPTERA